MKDPTTDMSKEDAIRHWMGATDPWKYRNKAQKSPRDLPTTGLTDVQIDQFGNVQWVRHAVDLPCFGMPLPYLRFIDRPLVKKRDNTIYKSKCTRCRASPACGAIVNARINCDKKLAEAADSYRRAVLPSLERDFRPGREGGVLIAELMSYEWVNANDRLRRELAEVKETDRRAKDANRKRALRSGQPDALHVALANRERVVRAEALTAYARSAAAPEAVKQMTRIGAERDANVWFCRLVLRWRKQTHGPAQIARELLDRGLDEKSYNTLRGIVPANLKRLDRWETVTMRGCTKPLWKPFDPNAASVAPLTETPDPPLTERSTDDLTRILKEIAP